ncbi:calcium uniporter protein 2 mitochondrial [Phtheirospermum japonicum]|uniref:Calcium uniporter protein 2 mitochondrial n=1 Tax=Phtheirospermum japonicum TaxID=374723 RepID=A0A830CZX5_9LAMI|nr:calcium uniporter protein 2 mitochondrial [Phtheirospermum japonicum]
MKLKLRQNEGDCVSYSEFMEICEKECSSKDQSLEFAKILDESGCVIVLGNIVFLRPEKVAQVMKAIQGLLMPIIPPSCDEALQEMEKQKTSIEEKAKLYVRRELWCGLGYLLVQTTIFMRLTFWELSWDVMEPICFYVTSMYFMGGYAFFLRTSEEPSFEGLYKSRLSTWQSRLMKAANFDVERYDELRRACHSHSLPNRML